MTIDLLKSKLHRATVTDACLDYEGSLGIDSNLMEKTGLRPYEKILVGNITNGHRFETYAIPEKPGTGAIVLNGAVAHLGKVGDLLVIMAFAHVEESEADVWKPSVVVLGEGNRPVDSIEVGPS